MRKITLLFALVVAATTIFAQTNVSLQLESRNGTPGQGFYEQPAAAQIVAPKGMVNESFEDTAFPPAGWTSLDADNDGNNWFRYEFPGTAHTGVGSATSASWTSTGGALTPNNFLIMPQVTPVAGESLRFFAAPQDPDYPSDKYKVVVSTTGMAAADFTNVLLTETLTTADTVWKMHNLSLDTYAGQAIYIAFVHYDCTDWFYMKLDDVLIGNTTDIETPREAITINMYPNPANADVKINSNARIETLSLVNIVGQTVLSNEVNSTNTTINVSELEAGVYFVKLETNKGIQIEKLVVE